MKYLVFFGIIAAVFVTGESLQCFNCSEAKCDNSLSTKNTVNCTKEIDFCFKQIINELADKKVLFKRGCYSLDKVHENIILNNTISTELYFCNKDFCNGVGSFTASLSIVFVTLLALMFASERW